MEIIEIFFYENHPTEKECGCGGGGEQVAIESISSDQIIYPGKLGLRDDPQISSAAGVCIEVSRLSFRGRISGSFNLIRGPS